MTGNTDNTTDSFNHTIGCLGVNFTTQVSSFFNAEVLTLRVKSVIIRFQDAALELFSTSLWRSNSLDGKVSQASNFYMLEACL